MGDEIKAYDMGRFQRIVQVESRRITGKFYTNSSDDGTTLVLAIDVTIWDEERRSGRVLRSNDLSCFVRGGVADLHKHMIASNKLAEVEDVWEEMLAVLLAVAEAARYQEEV